MKRKDVLLGRETRLIKDRPAIRPTGPRDCPRIPVHRRVIRNNDQTTGSPASVSRYGRCPRALLVASPHALGEPIQPAATLLSPQPAIKIAIATVDSWRRLQRSSIRSLRVVRPSMVVSATLNDVFQVMFVTARAAPKRCKSAVTER
jgi:hypothetical protein